MVDSLHTYIHTYRDTYILYVAASAEHTYIPTYMHAYIHTCIQHTYIHAYMPTCLHAYMLTCLHVVDTGCGHQGGVQKTLYIYFPPPHTYNAMNLSDFDLVFTIIR